MSAHLRILTALLASMALLAAGCSLFKGKGKDNDDGRAPVLTAWDRVMAMTGPNGEVTRDMALSAFATVYGPLPGVPAATGSRDGLHSGSAALRWITAYWTEITPEQRAAVGQAIGQAEPPGIADAASGAPPRGTTTTTPTTATRTGPSPGKPAVTPRGAPPHASAARGPAACPPEKPADGNFEAQLRAMWKRLAPQLELGTELHVVGCFAKASRILNDQSETPEPPGKRVALADAWGWVSGRTLECQVTSYPEMQALGPDDPVREEIVAHELGHCAEGILLREEYTSTMMPSWVLEGLPDWMAGKLTGHYSRPDNWHKYLTREKTSLTRQSYEAMGFWWELDYLGVNVWTAGRRAMEAAVKDARRDDAGAFHAALQDSEASILESWPASFRRDATPNLAWDTHGAGITGDRFEPSRILPVESDGITVELSQDAFVPALVNVDVQAEVLQFSRVPGKPVYGRFGPAGNGDFALSGIFVENTVFCTKGTQCACPRDTPKAGTAFRTITPGKGWLAFTGGADATALHWRGQTLHDFCGPEKTKTSPTPQRTGPANPLPAAAGPTAPAKRCPGCKSGTTHGDPHLVTFDGAFYDLQSAGEFTLTASLDDSMRVQTRQEPLGDSTSFGVNTAAAADVAGDRIGFYLRPRGGVEVHLNGRTTVPPTGDTPLPGGGTLSRSEAGYALAWPDGSQLYVTPTSTDALKVDMAVAETRKGRLNGLLGDADGNPANDLDAGGGRLLAATDPPYTDLHGVFADHWRVKPDRSLFDYAPGQSTSTFTDRTFPSTRTDPANLPGRAQAEEQCRAAGVTGTRQLAACALDVAVTGKREFAESAAAQQQFAEATRTGGTTDPGGAPIDPICLRPADKPGRITSPMNVAIGETVRAGGTGRLLCGGYMPEGDRQHNFLFSSPTARPVRIARAGDADCRLQWTVYKAYVSNDPVLPKTSVCREPGTLQLEPNTVYILVVDKPDPAVSGLYGFTLT